MPREIKLSVDPAGFQTTRWGVRWLKAVLVYGSAFLSFDLFAAERRARVLVDSFAEENYLKSKEADEGLVPETYHLVQGKRIGGYISDKSLNDVPFIEVAENLAEQLRFRDYYPAQAKEEGDLLIIVNWGVTQIQADFEELFPTDVEEETDEEGEASDSFLDGAPGSVIEEGGYTYSEQSNAALIGFDRALRRKDLGTQDQYELQEMLQNERYFMILSAFDWQLLRKTGEKKLLWTTRFSLDAVKQGFDEAHFALSRGAANYFGTNLDGDLGKVNTHVGPGEVKTGELKVIETVDE
jgi:hypothetical protein